MAHTAAIAATIIQAILIQPYPQAASSCLELTTGEKKRTAAKMNRRKRYLDPGGEVANIPKSTQSYIKKVQSHLEAPTERDVGESSHSQLACALAISATATENSHGNGTRESSAASEISDADITDTETSDASTNAAPDDVHAPQLSSCESMDSETFQPTAQNTSTDLSVEDIFALTVKFALDFALPWNGIEALHKLIVHILDRHDIPTSKYLFKKHVGVGVENAHFHFYCGQCMNLVAETSGDLAERNRVQATCSVCAKSLTGRQMMSDGNFFITLPVQQQLSSLLTDKSVANALRDGLSSVAQRDSSAADHVTDITDGALYKEFRSNLKSRDAITLTLSSDGSPVFKCSKYSMWPVQLSLNELPVHMRHKNLLMSALWYGQDKPDMTLLLSPVVREVEKLANNSVTWTSRGKTFHSKVKKTSFVFSHVIFLLLR